MLRQKAILFLFLLSLGLNGAFLLAQLDWLMLPALLLGWYLADLVSGLVHMYMDYRPCPPGKKLNDLFFYGGSRASDEYRALFRERMASINPFERVVYDFKNHHPRPHALGRRDLWRLIGSTVIVAALPVSLLLNFAAFTWAVPGWVIAFCVAFLIGGEVTSLPTAMAVFAVVRGKVFALYLALGLGCAMAMGWATQVMLAAS